MDGVTNMQQFISHAVTEYIGYLIKILVFPLPCPWPFNSKMPTNRVVDSTDVKLLDFSKAKATYEWCTKPQVCILVNITIAPI